MHVSVLYSIQFSLARSGRNGIQDQRRKL